MLAALTLVSYAFVYTPLKRTTPWNTLVGAVPGALPPLGEPERATAERLRGTVELLAGEIGERNMIAWRGLATAEAAASGAAVADLRGAGRAGSPDRRPAPALRDRC